VDDECHKFRMKETTNEMASIILSLNLGSTKTPIEEYVQLEEIVPFACISSMWDSCC
jgi:hypothetical protein